MAWWTVLISLVGVPVLTYFVGKRCIVLGFAVVEALVKLSADPFRHLSNRSQRLKYRKVDDSQCLGPLW